MERDSLGLIETSGLVAAIEAADAGSKAANVSFRGYESARAGLITVVFLGDVAAVRAAVTAGSAAAKRIGTVLSVHVIARPDRQLRVVANDAKPVDKLVSSPIIEDVAPRAINVEPVEVAPAAAETADTEKSVLSFAATCEVLEVPRTETEPLVPEISAEPAVEEPSYEEKLEAETVSDYASSNGHSSAEEEAEEEVVVAGRTSSPHKKEKVRKPRSKRKA